MKTKGTFWARDEVHTYRNYINRDSWFLKLQLILGLLVLLGVVLYSVFVQQSIWL
ncbi:hypothetical protein [Salinimicrobium sediminilitoris]|uniref:hypothetical protein n=1 Tax=Salinimicrobium sediminilitoris TaxID=2876715 RepID=UPI001E57B441|nr:hypothetical protein [Salinimicrobium sediminilitoris]MCC8361182.1 hypothetical protein [Salinimicrobium sediminilitoris]